MKKNKKLLIESILDFFRELFILLGEYQKRMMFCVVSLLWLFPYFVSYLTCTLKALKQKKEEGALTIPTKDYQLREEEAYMEGFEPEEVMVPVRFHEFVQYHVMKKYVDLPPGQEAEQARRKDRFDRHISDYAHILLLLLTYFFFNNTLSFVVTKDRDSLKEIALESRSFHEKICSTVLRDALNKNNFAIAKTDKELFSIFLAMNFKGSSFVGRNEYIRKKAEKCFLDNYYLFDLASTYTVNGKLDTSNIKIKGRRIYRNGDLVDSSILARVKALDICEKGNYKSACKDLGGYCEYAYIKDLYSPKGGACRVYREVTK